MQTPTWTTDAAPEGSQFPEGIQSQDSNPEPADQESHPEGKEEVGLDLPATREAISFMKTGKIDSEPKKSPQEFGDQSPSLQPPDVSGEVPALQDLQGLQ